MSQRQLHLLFVALFVVGGIVSVGYRASQTNDFSVSQSSRQDVTEGPIDLSAAEYDQQVAEFRQIIDSSNPTAALELLGSRMAQSDKYARSCHGLSHLIGHLAYIKYQNFAVAMSYQNDVCGNGYIHGVVEEHFNYITDIETSINQICEASFNDCVHGIGHGLMYFYDNDIPQALVGCDKLKLPSQKLLCIDGVYHENFETNTLAHTSKYLRPDDPAYPCYLPEMTHRSQCYYFSGRYLVRLMQDDYGKALEGCLSVDEAFQFSCARGVGSVILRHHLAQPERSISLCSSAPVNLVDACVYGAVEYYYLTMKSPSVARDNMCSKLPVGYYREQCFQVVSGLSPQ